MPAWIAVRFGLIALLVFWIPLGGIAGERRDAGDFDYYVLALSWSPTYCGTPDGRDDRLQCGSGRGFDFVVHGLWPQYRDGWPEYCSVTETALPQHVISGMLDIMPSPGLVRHQWKKHGTCTGLAPEDYFALTRRLYNEITIPARYVDPGGSIEVTVEQIVADFLATNRDLAEDMITVHCGNRRDRARLAELRICLSRNGEPRSCGGNARRQCRAERLVLPAAR